MPLRLASALAALVAIQFTLTSSTAATASTSTTAVADFQIAWPAARFYTTQHGRITRIYGAPFGGGDSPTASAEVFLANHGSMFDVAADDLEPGNDFNGRTQQPLMTDDATGKPKFTLVYYRQVRGGLSVFRGELRLLVRNDPGYPLVLAVADVRTLGDFKPQLRPEMVRGDLAVLATQQRWPGLVNFSPPRHVIWAGIEEQLAAAREAVVIEADNGLPAQPDYERRLIVADARTGELLYDENLVLHVDMPGSVSGMATRGFGAEICDEEVSTPMPYARVSQGETIAYADVNGDFMLSNADATADPLESTPRGRFFRVLNQTGMQTVLSLDSALPGPVQFVYNATNSSEYNRSEVNAYVQANKVRDFVLRYHSDYPEIAGQTEFIINVNINDICNAYYDGTAINFFRSGGGCQNSAFASVVHHEYGHHLVQVGGSGQGQYGEGMSDCISLLIANDSELGRGFQGDCTTGIRHAVNTFRYPCSNGSYGIHGCGQLLSGCVWDTAQALRAVDPHHYLDIVTVLTINSILLHTGSSITPQIAIDFLTLDDDNAFLNDGTPHYAQVAAGFSPHGMAPPALPPLAFSFPLGLPTLVDPPGGTSLRVRIVAQGGLQLAAGTAVLYVESGGGFATVPLTPAESNEFTAAFPAAACGANVRFYVGAQTTAGIAQYSPADAPTTTYLTRSAKGVGVLFADNFESDLGWTVQNSAGFSDGAWQRGAPSGGGTRGDPPRDQDGSGQCYLTRNAPGNSDVDGGTTTLTSPPLALAGADALIQYARWYSNNSGDSPGQDSFVVQIAGAPGGPFTNVESVGPSGPGTMGGWFLHSFRVSDFIAPTNDVTIQFLASDLGSASIVEAGVDAVQVLVVRCTAAAGPGDLNCDGLVNNVDIDPFVMALIDPIAYQAAQPTCDRQYADINGDGAVNNFDIAPFVSLILGE